jgi:hypothetical protein
MLSFPWLSDFWFLQITGQTDRFELYHDSIRLEQTLAVVSRVVLLRTSATSQTPKWMRWNDATARQPGQPTDKDQQQELLWLLVPPLVPRHSACCTAASSFFC